jgi:hypothetical protein
MLNDLNLNTMDKDKVYWTMKNGQKIDVDDMDENHLRNTLKMLLRNNRVKPKMGNIERKFNEEYIDDLPSCECDATPFDIY